MTQGFQIKTDNPQQPTTSHGFQNLPVYTQGDHPHRMDQEVDQANVWIDSYTQPSAFTIPSPAAPCPSPPELPQAPAKGIPSVEHAPNHRVFHAHVQPVTWVEDQTIAQIKSDIHELGQSLENTRQTLLQEYQFSISPGRLMGTLGPIAGLVTAGITMSAIDGGVVCLLGIAASYLVMQGVRQSAVQKQLQQKFPFEYDALRKFYCVLIRHFFLGSPSECRQNQAVRRLAEQCADLLSNAGLYRYIDSFWEWAIQPSPRGSLLKSYPDDATVIIPSAPKFSDSLTFIV